MLVFHNFDIDINCSMLYNYLIETDVMNSSEGIGARLRLTG